jgi:hypothetical protein
MLWGIGLGVQDSSLKAVLAGVIPPGKRSTGFGFFDTGFGIAWFFGSATMGLLYTDPCQRLLSSLLCCNSPPY